MNRTIRVAAVFLACLVVPVAAQQPAPNAAPAAQPDPIDEIVAAMRAGERALATVALTMRTSGRLPDGLTVTTRGVLHVARGAQPAVHARVDYELGDGLRGRAESAQSATGLVLFEDSPTSGEVFVQIDPHLVADLEWAGRVLRRDDLPGTERRAEAPLGSAIVAALARHFAFVRSERTTRGDDTGTWLTGPRRAGLDVQDADVPTADRVELFVRARDHALLEARWLEGDAVVQVLAVDALEVDAPIAPDVFRIDAGGMRPKPVRDVDPLWTEIAQALADADARSQQVAEARQLAIARLLGAWVPRTVLLDVRPSQR